MNTVYQKTEKSQRKIRQFNEGEKEKAMTYGFDLAFRNIGKKYFIITEDSKCLNFNTTIVL
jgi:hypothetical protein